MTWPRRSPIPFQYGLLYHSSFIGRAGPKHKGRISRFLANKCSIASRIDCFSGKCFSFTPLLVPSDNNCTPSETPTPKFGEALRQQVEERLMFFETGAPPGKNADAIRKVLDQLALEHEDEDEDAEMVVDADAEPVLPLIEAEPPRKKDKKKKKRKLDEMDVDEEDGEPVKKVKLSKEEKKALKKEKKRMRMEEEAAAEVRHVVCHSSSPNLRIAERIFKGEEGEKGEKEGREGKGKDGKEEQTLMTTTLLPHLPRPSFSSVSLIISSCLCISVNYAHCM